MKQEKWRAMLIRHCIAIVLVIGIWPIAQAQTFSVIHTFTGGGDGANPNAGVTLRASNLYGTAYNGGNGNGAVYEIMRLGNNWATIPISIFSGGGAHPRARVVFGPDGHLYGTTRLGGRYAQGIAFKLTPPLTVCKTANCFWTEDVLHQFGNEGALFPGYGDLTWDPQGNVYDTTESAGSFIWGVVYQLQTSNWDERDIHLFQSFPCCGPGGGIPESGVVFDTGGNLFGTTSKGGSSDNCGSEKCGTVFELTHPGWGEIVAYSFQNGSDGSAPIAGVTFDNVGNLYGATTDGGMGGGGTVFELSPSGNTWAFTLLYSFTGAPGQQCGPWGTLTIDAAGNLYGTTRCDGANSLGNIFELTNTENGWVYSSLHDFTGSTDGASPISNVTIDPNDGSLYGTASAGGSQGFGVVWMIKP